MAHNTAFRAQVYDRVSESGAIIAEWTGKACPREALGVPAALLAKRVLSQLDERLVAKLEAGPRPRWIRDTGWVG